MTKSFNQAAVSLATTVLEQNSYYFGDGKWNTYHVAELENVFIVAARPKYYYGEIIHSVYYLLVMALDNAGNNHDDLDIAAAKKLKEKVVKYAKKHNVNLA